MENREMVYEMAKKLDMIIEVWRDDIYIGKFKFINDELHKLTKQ